MILKLNENEKKISTDCNYMKQEEKSIKHKLFQNKTANRALIIATVIITVLIIGMIIMVNINLPWKYQ